MKIIKVSSSMDILQRDGICCSLTHQLPPPKKNPRWGKKEGKDPLSHTIVQFPSVSHKLEFSSSFATTNFWLINIKIPIIPRDNGR